MALDITNAPPPAGPPSPFGIPPQPGHAPDVPAAEPQTEGWWVPAVARMGTGYARLQSTAAAWLMASEMDDLDVALNEVAVDRDRRNEKAIGAQQRDLRKLRRAITDEADDGDATDAARFGIALGSVAQAGPNLVADAITRRDIERLRWRRRLTRIGIVLAAGYGTLTLTMAKPVMLPLELLAALAAVWIAGKPREENGDQEQQQVADGEAGTAAVPGPDGEAVPEKPLPPFFASVDLVKRAEERVRGELDLVTAFFRAGIISKAEIAETHTVGGLREDGPGWTATVELPRGTKAEAATSRVADLASALRIKKQRIEMTHDAGEDGHEGRVRLWVANSDTPFGKGQHRSELADAASWDFWQQGVPLGPDARGARQTMHLLWNSLLIGGLMGYGKSYFARLIATAAALDPTVRIVVLTGKSGPDWAPLKHVADKYIAGNSPATIREGLALIESLISEMDEKGQELERLFEEDPQSVPEGKITPAMVAADPRMGPVLLVVDELQELLDGAAMLRVAVDEDDADLGDGKPGRTPTRNGKEVMVEGFSRYVRVSRAAGGMGLFVTQRPDANSVPTALREVCAKRASYRVKGAGSAKMVLGDDAVNAGAAPHMLTESSLGVLVLDQGGEAGHVTLKADTITVAEFREICLRARELRINAGTLSGFAATHGHVDPTIAAARNLLSDAVGVLDGAGVDRARTERLIELLTIASPPRYADLTGAQLQARLRDAGAGGTKKLGAIDGMANPNGYTREQLADALAQHRK
jgi:hypothetical protein